MRKRSILRLMLLTLLLALSMSGAASAKTVYTGTLTNSTGVHEVSGYWKASGGKTYFVTSSVSRKKGWLRLGNKTYYLKGKGYRVTGVKKIGGKYYYFTGKGKLKQGLVTISGSTYYFDPEDGGARVGACTKEIDGVTYTFNSQGKTLRNSFDDAGTFYDAKGHAIQKSTLKHLLQVAMQPVGQTMYVWGGGWNQKDTGSGLESTTIGVSPQWKKFFQQQGSGYNYRNTRWQVHNGLDCSGYVGWVMYNTFNTESGHGGYVMGAQYMARTFANWGWGKYTSAGRMKNYRAGDIMSLASGHVYIVIGKCTDGSVVLVHSSPKGVMINGTATPGGKKKSKAWKLANKYMKTYFPAWYAKYPDVSRGTSYLTSYSRMRWKLSGAKSVMSDPDGYRNMTPAQILKDLFGG